MTVARLFIIFAALCLLVVQQSGADYVGAVVEHTTYQGTENETSDSKLSKNLDLYEQFVALSAKHKVQVLVFPEFGLTPGAMDTRADLYPYIEVIPEVSANVTPCGDASFNDRPILQRMSCAAQINKQLILVNMVDNIACSASSDPNCPSDGHYQYNTDVVFNEQGKLDGKYHKSHEIKSLQKAYDVAPTTEVTYKSSFGVEFGLFICYDIMFQDPPKVLRDRGIEHFLYAVAQYEIGEKTIIEGWSRNNNATVLSANLGSGGRKDCSGLIVNGNALEAQKYHLANKDFPEENILVATVPSK
jgi:predicted amidohydrolase